MKQSPDDAQPLGVPSGAPASPQAAVPDPPYDPALSFDVMADASALVRACIAGDGPGAQAVANHSAAPRNVAVILAATVVTACRRNGMSDTAINAMLRELSVSANDAVIDGHLGGDFSGA
jgi:hypothetical protein